MAQALRPEHGPIPGDTLGRKPVEPPTAHAVWPTFMRRTLAEEALRASKPQAPKQPQQVA